MTVSISLVLLLGIGVVLALRFRSATAGAVILAVLFGFYLAGTGAAPSVNDAVTSVADAFTDLGS